MFATHLHSLLFCAVCLLFSAFPTLDSHLEWIDTDVIAVSHTYVQNGDLMRDPEMTFRVDREKGALEPLTFRQDGSIQLYQEVYPEPGKWIPKLRSDLNTFVQQWLKNISQQGYHKREAVVVRDDEDVRLTFDQDGKVVEPAQPPAVENPGSVIESLKHRNLCQKRTN